MSSVLVVISSIVTSLATVGLVFVGISNIRLARSIRDRSEQHEQEIKDLMQASVVAIMLAPRPHASESFQIAVGRFKNCYKGKTPIFG